MTPTICAPEGANPVKVGVDAAASALDLPFHGRDFDEAREHARAARGRQHGSRYWHSANEPLLIAGVGDADAGDPEEQPVPRRDRRPDRRGQRRGLGARIVAKAFTPFIRATGAPVGAASARPPLMVWSAASSMTGWRRSPRAL